MYGYILTYPRLSRENVSALCSHQMGLQFMHPPLPTAGGKGKRPRQKNKTGDSKVESNDSPEIPDRGRHQTFPASLRGHTQTHTCTHIHTHTHTHTHTHYL